MTLPEVGDGELFTFSKLFDLHGEQRDRTLFRSFIVYINRVRMGVNVDGLYGGRKEIEKVTQ
jgi:hypothetical protein